MKAIVVLNHSAGQSAALNDGEPMRSVAEALKSAGIDADIRTVSGETIRSEVQRAATSDVDVVIAGGGDGTVSTVAAALAGSEMPLGILPLGTLNHLAKDLGIPLLIDDAARVIAEGHISKIDVGDVNGHIFINNSSLGAYPRMVLERDSSRKRFGLGKWIAMIVAVFKVFRRYPLLRVRLKIDDETVERRTPLVFVGNNRYELDVFNAGTRVCVDRGELSLIIANAPTRWRMLKLTFRALVGKLKQSRDFESFCLSNCSIETRRRRLHVAADGEVLTLRPPLHYRVLPGALRVCLPQKSEEAESSASHDEPIDDSRDSMRPDGTAQRSRISTH